TANDQLTNIASLRDADFLSLFFYQYVVPSGTEFQVFYESLGACSEKDCFPFAGGGCSFALKGQHTPARRIAAGNSKHRQRPVRAIDSIALTGR
ncbi:MAG: hypothetical protein LBG58_01360, partial [Planctomycetaceae bacterium]|nr:hypothetical protein [Planctomycetaceae bacterium]